MTEVRHMAHRLRATAMVSLASLIAGCGGADSADPPPAAPAVSPTTVTPAAEEPADDESPSEDGCGPDLAQAVQSKSPDLGEIAVDRCQNGWAYLGAAEGMGDTEQLWRVEDGAWQWVTSMPSALCPVDVEELEAPRWVVALFAYRAYDC